METLSPTPSPTTRISTTGQASDVNRIGNYQEVKRGTPSNARKAESIKVCQQLLKIAEN
jgi:hypothetical protein